MEIVKTRTKVRVINYPLYPQYTAIYRWDVWGNVKITGKRELKPNNYESKNKKTQRFCNNTSLCN